ncbi:hypothetical protein [Blastopirellula marina]|uniref:Uncharacterized protein n=1 Tax=Blastopirellula marina TaxID=124 RepID=A0A2S8FM77_9BACT|nr:hypothetical protein [Blastopirellula marina]PQO32964.1 hypothetical protein C5Y98_17655 [Blastopirellula marina]PTL43131.1 hypothetical protein C5Y97_17665 [Blastopirellula marina]
MRALLSRFAILTKLHWVTWGVLLVTTLGLVLIVVPGDLVRISLIPWPTSWEQQCENLRLATNEMAYAVDPRERNQAAMGAPRVATKVYQHGWPSPYLARALVFKVDTSGQVNRAESEPRIQFENTFSQWGGSMHHAVSWSNYDNWPFEMEGWLIRPWSLLLDVVVAVAILAAIGGLTEWRMRRDTGLLRFGLIDLLGGLTVIGVALGFYVYHANLQRIEHLGEDFSFVPTYNIEGGFHAGVHYKGPQWMRKLAGNQYFLPLLHHVDSVSVRADENWKSIYGELPKFTYMTSLDARFQLPLAALDLVEQCPSLEHFALPNLDRDSPTPLSRQGEPLFQIKDLPRLEKLNLISIRLRGDAYSAKQIELVAAFPTLQRITLEGAAASQEEIEKIKSDHPNIEFFVLPDPQIFMYPSPTPTIPIR